MTSSTAHPHDLVNSGIPDRLPGAELRNLSALNATKALTATVTEWLMIIAAMTVFIWVPNVLTYIAMVIFIGARQHALTVIGHDASHFRYLPNRTANDIVGNLLLMWPMFISVNGFRKWHGDHHKYLGDDGDGNRFLWKTHDKNGELKPAWTYPKDRRALIAKLIRHSFFGIGIWWIVRGMLSVFVTTEPLYSKFARIALYSVVATILTMGGWWWELLILWVVPLCTWHIAVQYMRLIAEHSAVQSADPAYQGTRTTIPTALESLLVLPRNIGYHIEHHWYPAVPFYNLPALHQRLMRTQQFKQNADISYSIFGSLAATTRPKS